MKKYISRLLATLSILLTLYLAKILSHFLIIVFISFVIACAMEIPVKFLQKRGFSRRISTITIITSALLAITSLTVGTGAIVFKQVNGLIMSLDLYYNNIAKYLVQHGVKMKESVKASEYINQYMQSYINDHIASTISLLGSALLVIIFTYYFIVDGFKFRKAICLRLPKNIQEIVLNVWEISIEKTGSYFAVRTLITSIAVIGMSSMAFLLNLPYFWVLGLWYGIISQGIPIFGTYLGASLPLIITVNINPWLSGTIIAYIFVFQLFADYYLIPKFASKQLDVHPVVILASVVIGGTVLGVIGVIVSIPVAATTASILSTYLHRKELVDEHHLLTEPIYEKEKLKINIKNKKK